MTKYVVIALMNLAVVGAIAGNAIVALMRGCNIDGTCSNGSNLLTWMLGVGLGLVVVGGFALLVRKLSIHRRQNFFQSTSILAIPRKVASAAAGIRNSDDIATAAATDEAMLSRLARMARNPADDDAADESALDEFERMPVEACPVEARHGDAALGDAACKPNESILQPVEPGVDEPKAIIAPIPAGSSAPAANLHLVVRDGERTGPRPDRPAIAPETDTPETRFAWLFDGAAGTNAAHVRRDIGFPWVVAGIDHVCQGVARFGPMLADTEIAAEASAWRQVTASLPREEELDSADAQAFTDWLNMSLRLIGRSGEGMMCQAVEALETEAVGNPAVARCLPRDFWADRHPFARRIARYG